MTWAGQQCAMPGAQQRPSSLLSPPTLPAFVPHTRPQAVARRPLQVVAATDFHQKRLSMSTAEESEALPKLIPLVREAQRDDELEAAAWLRARSFYAYPEERKFAGEIHQMMVAEEELKALKAARLERMLNANSPSSSDSPDVPRERSACIIAVVPVSELPGGQSAADEKLLLTDDGDTWQLLVGSLDLHAVRAMPGELLIASCTNAAYLANVCTAVAARRRGVGEALLAATRDLARSWGVEGIFVHTLAVNEIGMAFYGRNGFVVEKEESPNQAHHRGRCLDGIEGRGRSVLLRDTLL